MKIKKCKYRNNILTLLITLFLSFLLQVHLTTEINFKNSSFEFNKDTIKLKDTIIHLRIDNSDNITEDKIEADFILDFNKQGVIFITKSNEMNNESDENLRKISKN
jgi:hypothetical protein